jgi:hypothetical protein
MRPKKPRRKKRVPRPSKALRGIAKAALDQAISMSFASRLVLAVLCRELYRAPNMDIELDGEEDANKEDQKSET